MRGELLDWNECGCSAPYKTAHAYVRSGPRNHEMKVKPWCRKRFRIWNSSQDEYSIAYFHERRGSGWSVRGACR